MSISHHDFFRLLPLALSDMPFTRHGNRVEARRAGRCVEIDVGPESKRRLGALELPITRISINLSGFGAEEEAAFLERFDLAYRRGGG